MSVWVPDVWHFCLVHWEVLVWYAGWFAFYRTPPGKRYRKRIADRCRARRLRKPGKPDENGWCPRTNYERKNPG